MIGHPFTISELADAVTEGNERTLRLLLAREGVEVNPLLFDAQETIPAAVVYNLLDTMPRGSMRLRLMRCWARHR